MLQVYVSSVLYRKGTKLYLMALWLNLIIPVLQPKTLDVGSGSQ